MEPCPINYRKVCRLLLATHDRISVQPINFFGSLGFRKASIGQYFWHIETRGADPVIRHSVVNVVPIRCAQIVAPVDTGRKDYVRHSAIALLRQRRRQQGLRRTIANDLRMFTRKHHNTG
jgi:hypothetical protein